VEYAALVDGGWRTDLMRKVVTQLWKMLAVSLCMVGSLGAGIEASEPTA
jgi:hypothetical protein